MLNGTLQHIPLLLLLLLPELLPGREVDEWGVWKEQVKEPNPFHQVVAIIHETKKHQGFFIVIVDILRMGVMIVVVVCSLSQHAHDLSPLFEDHADHASH
jgi:hypothetical protein